MHKPKFLFPAIALVLMVAAWTARGWLDEITMYAGRFHVFQGKDLGKIGYVTGHNNLSVICLTNGQAIFSQIFPHVANMP